MLFAVRRPASRELTYANEVHRDALNAFTAEVHESETAAPAFLRSALEGAIIPALLPLIPLVIQRMRKHRTDPAMHEPN